MAEHLLHRERDVSNALQNVFTEEKGKARGGVDIAPRSQSLQRLAE
jgi:hypothetical protein